MSFLCRLGLHSDIRVIWSGQTHGCATTGEVLQCRRCDRYRKWGTAFYPDYIKNEIAKTEIKGSKILLFCDNPACFATHIAKKNYAKRAVLTGSNSK